MTKEQEERQIADLLLEHEKTQRRLVLLEGQLKDFGKQLLNVAERLQKGEPWPQDSETLRKVPEILPVFADFFETNKRMDELSERKKKAGF